MSIKYKFDPIKDDPTQPEYRIPKERKAEALEAVSSFVLESVLDYVRQGQSPVAGYGRFKALSKTYREEKIAEGAGGEANLEFTGNMLSALECDPTGSKVVLHIDDEDEAAKAEGHCQISERHEYLPKRRFIPAPDETFKASIWSGIRTILKDFEEDE